MLVLTRKIQQQIQIGPHITITILQVKGQSVRVGIEAPRDVCVLRTELAKKLASEEQAEAVQPVAEHAAVRSRVETPVSGNTAATPRPTGLLRCRAPRSVRTPLRQHLKRPGPASRSSATCLATTSSKSALATMSGLMPTLLGT